MSAPLRFLGLAVFAWVGVRAASLGFFPGQTALVPVAAAAPVASAGVAASRSEPYAYADAMTPPPPAYGFAGYPPPYPYPASYPPTAIVPYSPPTIVIRQPAYAAPPPTSAAAQWGGYAPLGEPLAYAPLDDRDWPAPPVPLAKGRPRFSDAPSAPARFDRWQLSAWALLRNTPGAPSLSSYGTLGGS